MVANVANSGAAWNDMEMDIFRVVIILLAVVCGRDSAAVTIEGWSTVSMGFGFGKEDVNWGVNCAS